MSEPADRMSDDDRLRIVERYTTRFKEFGVDIRTLNPGNEQKYRVQHCVHASIGDLHNKTLLDVGCGLAHYYEFLRSRKVQVNYIGYDIVEPFIEINRERYPEATFEVRDISINGIIHTPDYVCMCQVFNNKYTSANNEETVKKAISESFAAARIGVSIDMLSDHVNYKEDHLFYFSPERLFSFAKSITRFVMLRHDYLPYHFTLFLYKEPTLL